MKKTLLLAQNEALKTELEERDARIRHKDGQIRAYQEENERVSVELQRHAVRVLDLKDALKVTEGELKSHALRECDLHAAILERTRQRDLAAGDYLELHKEHLELGLELELTQRRQRAAEEQRAEAVNNKLQAERRSSRIVCVTVAVWLLAGSAWVIACA